MDGPSVKCVLYTTLIKLFCFSSEFKIKLGNGVVVYQVSLNSDEKQKCFIWKIHFTEGPSVSCR